MPFHPKKKRWLALEAEAKDDPDEIRKEFRSDIKAGRKFTRKTQEDKGVPIKTAIKDVETAAKNPTTKNIGRVAKDEAMQYKHDVKSTIGMIKKRGRGKRRKVSKNVTNPFKVSK